MPNLLTPAFGASTFSATLTIPVNFGSNPNRALFGQVFFDKNFEPNVGDVTSVVIDPTGANIACTIGARRAGVTVLGQPGFLQSFAAAGSLPTGTKDVVITANTADGLPRGWCQPLDDTTALSAEVTSTGFNTAPSATVSSATGRKVYAMVAGSLADGQTITPSAPATQATRVLQAAAANFAGAIWQEDGAASVTIDGSYTGSTTQWAVTAFSATGPDPGATLTGSITGDDALPAGALGLQSSSVTGSIVLDATLPTGQAEGVAGSTVRTMPFSRNSGARPVSLPGNAIAVLTDDASLTRIAGATSLTLGLDGRLSFSDAALPAPGTSVIAVTREADGRLGVERYQVVSG
jgi:hypothetical protein